MKKPPASLALVSAFALSACNQNTITATTQGTQATASVKRITGVVAPSVKDLNLTLPGLTLAPATITLPSDTKQTYASFTLDLPGMLPDSAVTRFNTLFAPQGCKMNLTGNYLARVAVVDTLSSSGTDFISQTNATASGVLIKTQRVMYFYSDRATYLRGTVTCALASGQGSRVTGFELNLLTGWNRVVLTESSQDDAKSTFYATTPRTSGNAASIELWQPAPTTTGN